MQLQRVGLFIPTQNNTLPNGFTLSLSVVIFENGNNYSFSRARTICQSCLAYMSFTGHQVCTFMYPKCRIPFVAINSHQLCSSACQLHSYSCKGKGILLHFTHTVPKEALNFHTALQLVTMNHMQSLVAEAVTVRMLLSGH